jgi:amino acid adenylation domain-containing protein
MTENRYSGIEVAIVGMAGRFPGAPDIGTFWQNLCAGVESIRSYTPEELDALGVDPADYSRPDFVTAGAQVDDVERFDYRFWGYSPREAALMDPQQRLFLETCWEAMEHSGHGGTSENGLVGVYAGMGLSTYLVFNLRGNPAVSASDEQLVMLGNDKDFLCTRVAYHLDLRGPCITVQTGCSTSLVATHLAVDGLLSYQCDLALAGGVCVVLPQRTGYLHHPGSTASSDGHCRAFDARGDGTVFGSGAGVLVLKRLQDALDQGDTVYAVIKGSAVNNDGAQRAGFTAPGVEGQAEVIVRALNVADVAPGDISYVEAHGTGTRYGDPVEAAALASAFQSKTSGPGSCALGSVKTNVGHLDAAAGAASLIKTALALYHRQLPPSLNFQVPNPQIDFNSGPFYVNTSLRPWPEGPRPRRAGVSGFGFGGTNAHLILEEPPEPERIATDRSRPQLLTLSAKTATALPVMTERLAAHLSQHPEQALADVAHTLQQGRAQHEHRRAFVAVDRDDAIHVLRDLPSRRMHQRHGVRSHPDIVFMLPGLGDQYPGMAAGLYRQEMVFRQAVDECCDLLYPLIGLDLRTVLYPEGVGDPAGQADLAEPGGPPGSPFDLRVMLLGAGAESDLQRTLVAHPALFVTEYAIARLLESWQIRPSALIGHSLGEYVVAALAGVFSLPDILRFVARRAQLISVLPGGRMLAIPLPVGEARQILPAGVSVALVNSPKLTVVAGPDEAVAACEQLLTDRGVTTRRLRAEHAFHSPMLTPVIAPLTELASDMELSPPLVPFVSNTTGDWITPEQATSPSYWAKHSVAPVEFSAGLDTLSGAGDQPILLEVGPGQSLASLVLEHAGRTEDRPVVCTTMRAAYDRRQSDLSYLLDAAAQLWITGVPVSLPDNQPDRKPRRVALPSYPFERERAWIAPAAGSPAALPQPGRRSAEDRWFWVPGWQTLPLPRSAQRPGAPGSAADERNGQADRAEHWIVLAGTDELSPELIGQAAAPGRILTVVQAGDDFAATADGHYRIDPDNPAHYEELLAAVETEIGLATVVIDLRHRVPADVSADVSASGLFQLSYLSQALGHRLARNAAGEGSRVWVISHGLARVESGDELRPAASLLLGAAMCAPQEYEGIKVTCLDVPTVGKPGLVARRVLDVIAAAPDEPMLAQRGDRLWASRFDRLDLAETVNPPEHGAVHLIVGGLGTIGLELAEHLAERHHAHFVLTRRTPFPEPGQWATWLAGHPADDPVSVTIRRLERLTELGSTVLIRSTDVADPVAMRALLDEIELRYGRLDGVTHAAGLTGQDTFRMIDEVSPDAVAEVLRAKVTGTEVLGELLRDRPPGYVLLISSNVSILGGIGAVAYSAANVFVNTYAAEQHRLTGARWLSVSIEEWLSEGATAPPVLSFTQYGLQPEEGRRVLYRALWGAPAGWTAVVTGDLEQRIDQWIRHPEASRRARGERVQRAPRPQLTMPFAAPRDETEHIIAEFWQDMLGVEPVGRDDDFYQLGGHSLLATQIISRVRSHFGVALSLLMLLESPTVAGFAQQVRLLLESGTDAGGPPIIPVPRDSDAPLSYAQRQFWFFDQLAPGNPLYNIPDVVEISGPLRLDLLQESINQIVARHESLRTSFAMAGNEPVQRIAPEARLTVAVIDLTGVSEAHRRAAWEREARAEADRPFDLSQPLLLRATALKLADEQHILLVTAHHIIFDAWSSGVFIRELAICYAARCGGSPETLPALKVQYPDYAVWQKQMLDGGVREQQLKYWRAKLGDAPPLTGFPPDYERPPVQTFAGATHPVELSASLVDRLVKIGSEQGCTLFMTLLAAFYGLLHRYTGDRDLVVGSPIAGRVRPELEDLIGVFVNMTPLRMRAEPDEAFISLMARVRDMTTQAYAHQELPFELLVEDQGLPPTLSHQQIFQTVLVLQNAPLPPLELSGVALKQIPMAASTAKFDLMLMLRQTASGAVGGIEYATDLYSARTVAQLSQDFTALLEAICDDPLRCLADLETRSAREQRTALVARATGLVRAGPAQTVHELFSEQAKRTPDARAVYNSGAAPETGLTFGEADAQSDGIARVLRDRGVKVGSLVGVCLERAPQTVVILLGIMKAGAAYVPLDPAYPQARLDFMAQDARLEILIVDTAPGNGVRPAGPPSCQLLPVQELFAAAAWAPSGPPGYRVRPQDPAYVLYTSGSTGVPKGAVGLHQGMVNRFRWMWRAYPFAEDEVMAQKTSLSFLDSFWEMFGSLTQGIPVAILPHSLMLEPEELVRTLGQQKVTRIVLVPSLLKLLLDTIPDLADRLPRLRYWTTSGEAISGELAGRFLAAMPGRVLLNLYGSSEVSADVTWHQVTQADTGRRLVPIGGPIDNTVVHVLDDRMQPVPTGVTGEVFVGGIALGRGYLGQPGLTADRFVPDPLSSAPGAILFRTGDRARWRHDGAIEYLGRRDQQVKVRGFRVELGEVESALTSHPDVAQAVVAAERDSLIAYCVPVADVTFDPQQVMNAVRAQLPQHMVPLALVTCAELPLTQSGKLDRSALPALAEAPGATAARTPPRDVLEEALCAIWAEVLEDGGQPGVHDNFYAAGGHSLAAVRFVMRVREDLGSTLPLRAFLSGPTIAELADTLREESGSSGELTLRASLVVKVAALSAEQVEELLAKTAEGGEPS